jgi:recombination protein RecR
MRYPSHLLKIIEVFKKLPGIGTKSAERFAFQLLNWKEDHLKEMAELLRLLPHSLRYCTECGCLMEQACPFCAGVRKNSGKLSIVAYPKDVFTLEAAQEFKGLYHVLGGLLSPMDNRGPDQLRILQLKQRIQELQIQEVVIALDSTLEGDATALFLKRELAPLGAAITRLAFGMPMGSSFEYIDPGTLARAISGRSLF